MALLIRAGRGGDTPRNSCKGCATELSKFPRGALPYKSDRDAYREIQIKPKGTTVGVAQAVKLNLSSKGDFCVVSVRALFVNFFAIPEWARIVTFHPKHPK